MLKAKYRLVYEGRDVTRDLEGWVLSLTYKDKTVGEADELTVVVRDDDHRWKGEWNPKQGDRIVATIESEGRVLECGAFTVDELNYGGGVSGHTLSIGALSAGVKTQVRTKSSFSHEGKTLRQLVGSYADKYGWRVEGLIRDFRINKVTQFHETDLGFLHRIASEFGYLFTLRGNVLVFSYLPDMAREKSVVLVKWDDARTDYTIRDKVAGIYVRGQYRYHNRKEKKTYDELVKGGANPSVDVLREVEGIDNDEQGLYKVEGKMYKKNLDQVEIQCTVPGNCLLVSGVHADVEGWWNYSGKYFCSESVHVVDRNGNYVTSPILKKVVASNDSAVSAKVGKSKDDVPLTLEGRIRASKNVEELVREAIDALGNIVGEQPLGKDVWKPNISVLQQVAGRLYTIGNRNGVGAFLRISNDTIEKRYRAKDVTGAQRYANEVMELLQRKMEAGTYR